MEIVVVVLNARGIMIVKMEDIVRIKDVLFVIKMNNVRMKEYVIQMEIVLIIIMVVIVILIVVKERFVS